MNINVNVLCRVKLTEYGIDLLLSKAPYKFTLSTWNKDTKEFTTELWDIMKLFGECFWMGNDKIPFEKNNIFIIKE